MTHEEICTYEVAKLAKEKGFNCKVNNYYQATKHYCETLRGIELHSECWKLETDDCYSRYNKGSEDIVSAPTQSLLQRWLREEKNVHIEIVATACGYMWIADKTNGTAISDSDILDRGTNDGGCFDTYELALEDALKYALEILV